MCKNFKNDTLFATHSRDFQVNVVNCILDTTTIDSTLMDTTATSLYQLEETNISIYPNPFTNDFHIQMPLTLVKASYLITSSTGQVLQSGIFNEEKNTISSTNWSSGVYFIQIKWKDRNITKMLIKY